MHVPSSVVRALRLFAALLLAFAVVPMSVVTASAHTPRVTHDCAGLSVNLVNYNAHETNTVKVTVNDEVVLPTTEFDTSYVESFAFDDSTQSNSYEVKVVAGDDPDGDEGWTKTFTGTSEPCAPVCEDDPQISHTFDGTRSGTVTVGGDQELCDPLYIKAVTWTYDNPPSQWPQTREGFNDYSLTEGTISYEAPASNNECIQHDIYASFDKSDLDAVGTVLNGPDNPFDEKFLHELSQGDGPTYWSADGNDCGDKGATPVDSSVTDECADGGVLVTIPETEGVKYTVNGDVVTGTYLIPVGEDEDYSLTITPVAEDGYVLTDDSDIVVSGTRDCVQPPSEVIPVAPSVSDECADGGVAVTIPTTTGVDYLVDGDVVTGTVLVPVGEDEDWSFTVTPRAQQGFELTDEAPLTLEGTRDCLGDATPVAPSVSDECADGGVAVTIPTTTGVDYMVGGEVVTGTVLVPVAEDADWSLTVTPVAQDGFELTDEAPLTLEGTRDCEEPAQPTATSAAPSVTCTTGGIEVLYPTDTSNVTYDVQGVDGTVVTVAEGSTFSIRVTVTAADGFVLEGPAEYTLSGTRDCETAPVVEPEPEPDDETRVLGTRFPGGTDVLARTGDELALFGGIGSIMLVTGAVALLATRRKEA